MEIDIRAGKSFDEAVDTIAGLRRASSSRFKDGERLRTGRRRLGAVYLYGYCGEMIVKSACYAIAGYDPSEAITRQVRKQVSEGAKSFGLEIKGPHDLLNWSLLLAALIDRQGGSGDLSGAVRGHAQLLSVRCGWSAEMRYRSARYSAADLDGARASARWFLKRISRYPNE